MSWFAMQTTGFSRERVSGMAGVLDTARYRSFIAEALVVSVRVGAREIDVDLDGGGGVACC